VVRRNPALIVVLSVRSSCAICTWRSDLVGWIDLLRATRRPLGALCTFTPTSFLREEGTGPGSIDEVQSAAEDTTKDEIEKEPRMMSVVRLKDNPRLTFGIVCLQLWIEKARIWLDDANGLAESGDLVNCAVIGSKHGKEVELQILSMEDG
jgi:hypothetical protein